MGPGLGGRGGKKLKCRGCIDPSDGDMAGSHYWGHGIVISDGGSASGNGREMIERESRLTSVYFFFVLAKSSSSEAVSETGLKMFKVD